MREFEISWRCGLCENFPVLIVH